MVCKVLSEYFLKLSLLFIGLQALSGCNEQPIPGSLSPSRSQNTQSIPRWKYGRPLHEGVKPVKKTSSGVKGKRFNAIASNSYDYSKQALQDLIDELTFIADRSRQSKKAQLLDAIAKAGIAIDQLEQDHPRRALQAIRIALVHIRQLTRISRLPSKQGRQFIDEIEVIRDSILNGESISGGCRGSKKSLWIIKEEGGVIAHCGHKIEIPQGALEQDGDVYIATSDDEFTRVDFGPDGWFEKPVKITISYKYADLEGGDENALKMAWLDEDTGQWYSVDCTVDPVKQTVTATVWHFTQYTLSF